ncbi:MAG: hypothetical protein KAI43_06765 [Candidatus Aureabacteria bacterium]|nr:hypothetical protein [Candidatus Auribacterota bacterium]
MAKDQIPTDYFQKLSMLIDGYQGYRSPKKRLATSSIFEAFLSEKLKAILKIVEDRYNEQINEKKNLHLLLPLSNIIKNLTDCFQFTTYERSQRYFFLHEYKFAWEGVENMLYKIDYLILQYISMLVDKISRFDDESKKHFEDFVQVALMFREKLSERKKLVYEINQRLVPINQLLNNSIRNIRERHITKATFNDIEKAIKMYPKRLNTYIDIFEAIQRYITYYVRLNENIPLIDFYDTAMLFVTKYREYMFMLVVFLDDYTFDTDEEKECEAYLIERRDKAPDFDKLIASLEASKNHARIKQAERKQKEEIIQQATVEFKKGLRFEKEFRYVEAIALYQKTLSIDKEYIDAFEAIDRCKSKNKAFSLFLKAQKKIKAGNFERAKSLLLKTLKKAPKFDEAKKLLEYVKKEELQQK